MESLKNVLQPHSEDTLFVFNDSSITSVIVALTLMLGVNGLLMHLREKLSKIFDITQATENK